MQLILSLIIGLSLVFTPPSYAAKGQGGASSGGGVTAPVSTANAGCGTANSCNTINAVGAIAAAGTASCDLSLGNQCSFSGSSGTVTIAVPTNGVQGVQYYLLMAATGTFTYAYATATPGWRIWVWQGGVDTNPPSNGVLANGGFVSIPFHYDGTNYRLDTTPTQSSANKISSNAFTGGTFAGTTGTFSGNVALTGGSIFSETGGTAPTLTAGCNGAGSSVATGSTNNKGQFTTQTAAATTCTITWGASATWPQSPFCTFTGNLLGVVPPTAPGTSTYVITFTATAAAIVVNYTCM